MKRCKQHLSDLSSCIGVCASCLHERLILLSAAQLQLPAAPIKNHRIPDDTIPPPLLPPLSVSPYVARLKLGSAAVSHHSLADQRFYSTPQVGSTGGASNKRSKWTLLSNLFRSASWFSSTVSGRRRKQSRLFSVDESNPGVVQRPCGDRGMSPEICTNGGIEGEYGDGSAGDLPETTKRAAQSGRRGGGRRNVPGMVLCLSPLVRASPNRHWNQKGGMPPEIAVTGEIRGPVVKPHLAYAASYCANRSRKIADFGRFNPNR